MQRIEVIWQHGDLFADAILPYIEDDLGFLEVTSRTCRDAVEAVAGARSVDDDDDERGVGAKNRTRYSPDGPRRRRGCHVDSSRTGRGRGRHVDGPRTDRCDARRVERLHVDSPRPGRQRLHVDSPRPGHERLRAGPGPPRSACSCASGAATRSGAAGRSRRRRCTRSSRTSAAAAGPLDTARALPERKRSRCPLVLAFKRNGPAAQRCKSRGSSVETSRSDAAAAMWIVRGDESRRRRGCDVDIPWGRIAATPAKTAFASPSLAQVRPPRPRRRLDLVPVAAARRHAAPRRPGRGGPPPLGLPGRVRSRPRPSVIQS